MAKIISNLCMFLEIAQLKMMQFQYKIMNNNDFVGYLGITFGITRLGITRLAIAKLGKCSLKYIRNVD